MTSPLLRQWRFCVRGAFLKIKFKLNITIMKKMYLFLILAITLGLSSFAQNQNGGVGCMDVDACNYCSWATEDVEDEDGNSTTCDYSCIGCADSGACNYNAMASIDDGSCTYECVGCTDGYACNYDETSTIDSNQCDYSCIGCEDEGACNFLSSATSDLSNELDEDGNVVEGPWSDNNCDYSCIGCTDPFACNYEENEDGTPLYTQPEEGACEYAACTGCMEPGSCNYLECYAGGFETVLDEDGNAVLDEDGNEQEVWNEFLNPIDCTIPADVCDIESCVGCMDSEACNYDETAQLEGDCDYISCGACMDVTGCNYGDLDGDGISDLVDEEGAFNEEGFPCDSIFIVVTTAEGDTVLDTSGSPDQYIPGLVPDSAQFDWVGQESTLTDSLDADGNVVLNLIPSDQQWIAVLDDETGLPIIDEIGQPYEVDLNGEPDSLDMVAVLTGGFSVIDGDTIWAEVYEWQDNPGFNPTYGDSLPACLPTDAVDAWCYNVNYGSYAFVENPNYNENYGTPYQVDAPICDSTSVVGDICYNENWGTGPEVNGWVINPDYNENYGEPILELVLNTDCNENYGDPIPDGFPDQFIFNNADLCDFSCWGCDNVQYSGLVVDDCGVCGGDNSSCSGNTTDIGACNYNPDATLEVDAEFESCMGCMEADACNYCPDCTIPYPDPLGDEDTDLQCLYSDDYADVDGDGEGDCPVVPGCTDETAYNYDETATEDDGSCEPVVLGCTDSNFTEFDAAANTDDGSCVTDVVFGCMTETACNYNDCGVEILLGEDGNPVLDADGNEQEVAIECNTEDNSLCLYEGCVGCMDPTACNYDENADIPDVTTVTVLDDDGNAVLDEDGNEVTEIITNCDYDSCYGCIDAGACNYGTGFDVANTELLAVDTLGGFDMTGSEFEWTDSLDVDGNIVYNLTGSEDSIASVVWYLDSLGNQEYAVVVVNEDYNPNYGTAYQVQLDPCGDDAEEGDPCYNANYGAEIGDGISDVLVLGGVLYADGSCEYETCAGCTDELSCNYTGSTIPAFETVTVLDEDGNAVLDEDGNEVTEEVSVCDYECVGCMDITACNFDPLGPAYTIEAEGSCDYGCYGCTNVEACNYDATATLGNPDDECNWDCVGCTESNACNYNNCTTTVTVFDEDGNAVLDDDGNEVTEEVSITCLTNGGDEIDFVGAGACEFTSCLGCMDPNSCDYDPTALFEDEANDCTYSFDCYGCTDTLACNYSVSVENPITGEIMTQWDNLSCDYGCYGCMDNGFILEDQPVWVMNDAGTPDDESDDYPVTVTNDNGTPDDTVDDFEENLQATDSLTGAPVFVSVNISGVAGQAACNYNQCFDVDGILVPCDPMDLMYTDNDACIYDCIGCMNPMACNYVEDDAVTVDFGCLFDDECVGCMAPEACNYNPNATVPGYNDDGSTVCEYETCAGCMDEEACNYIAGEFTINDLDQCDYACHGCTDVNACNPSYYSVESFDENGEALLNDDGTPTLIDVIATFDDGSCIYECVGCTDDGAQEWSPYPGTAACNFIGATIQEENSCDYSCIGCFNVLGCDYDADAIANETITVEGECNWDCYGCTDPLACNGVDILDPDYDGPIEFPCVNEDGTSCCTYGECTGCMDPTSCSFNPEATISIQADCVEWDACVGCTEQGMTYESGFYTPYANFDTIYTMNTYGLGSAQAGEVVECIPLLSECGLCPDGTLDCFNGEDLTGSPDSLIMCTEPFFNDGGTPGDTLDDVWEDIIVVVTVINDNGTPDDTDDDFEEQEIVWCENPDYNPNYGEVPGCMDMDAVNYDENATVHIDGDCLYFTPGCMDEAACNYNENATSPIDELGDEMECWFVDGVCDTCSGETDGTGTIVDNDADNDGVCDDVDPCPGFDDTVDTDGDGIADGCDACPEDAENDADGDGLCAADDPCDYDANNDVDGDGLCDDGNDPCPNDANNDEDGDGLCADVDPCPIDPLNDEDGDGVCGDADGNDACPGGDDNIDELPEGGNGIPDFCDVYGCTDPAFGNYNADATIDDGSCETLCGCAEGYLYELVYNSALGNTITVTNSSNETVWTVEASPSIYDVSTICLDGTDCYDVTISDNADAIAWDIYECADCGLDGDCLNNDSYWMAGTTADPDEYQFGDCIEGCTDATACNYDDEANIDDDSCCFNCGCTDSEADNFSALACYSDNDDLVCEYWGCTDEDACNWDEGANVDDGSCSNCYEGDCDTYPEDVYNCLGECISDLRGCTDEDACNYDETALCDDESCEYAEEFVWTLDCDGDGFGDSAEGTDSLPGSIVVCPSDVPENYVDNDDDFEGTITGNSEPCDDPVSLEEDLIGLSIYPNPASDVLNIEFTSNANKDVTIEFVNMIGQVISSDNFVVTNGLLDIEIDMTKYSKGVYQINLISNSDVVSKTIMVE